ncbi:hypothetical protein HETIRDRAFT_315939 [Heterobasidion irregulare TC 32-1]|uniref:Uncharacterized protein n=1 Tax=Heterobasidion irregulare (strain TC 32-1) TaxID=747525 RepID=W4K9C7_HETIT|nr:uncharacterized protein HETIRDRAFT_315939 [Heterobasidion irregulare TC 32-1]ETW82383.1 hypothetical protein HETIRDRAFT_315939 [Heterobasidion irregulare TC 32-1]
MFRKRKYNPLLLLPTASALQAIVDILDQFPNALKEISRWIEPDIDSGLASKYFKDFTLAANAQFIRQHAHWHGEVDLARFWMDLFVHCALVLIQLELSMMMLGKIEHPRTVPLSTLLSIVNEGPVAFNVFLQPIWMEQESPAQTATTVTEMLHQMLLQSENSHQWGEYLRYPMLRVIQYLAWAQDRLALASIHRRVVMGITQWAVRKATILHLVKEVLGVFQTGRDLVHRAVVAARGPFENVGAPYDKFDMEMWDEKIVQEIVASHASPTDVLCLRPDHCQTCAS